MYKKYILAYRGCYSKSNLADQTPTASSKSMTVGYCVLICKAASSGSGTNFAGIEGENCLCFNNFVNVFPLTNRHCR